MCRNYLIVTDNVKKTVDEVFKWVDVNYKTIPRIVWINDSCFTIYDTDVKIYIRSVDRPETIRGLRICRIYFTSSVLLAAECRILEYLRDRTDELYRHSTLDDFIESICEDLQQDELKAAINNKYGVHSGRYPWPIQKQLLDACKLQKDVEEMTKYQTLFNPVTAGVLQDIDYRLSYLADFKLIDTKEDNKMQNYSKMIKDVIFNDPATIIMWKDGTKTVVRNSDDTPYDPEKGFAMAIAKKALGNEGNYYDIFKKYVPTIPIPKDLYTTEDEDVKARIGTIATRMAMDVESTGKKWTGLTRDDWKKVVKQAKREVKLNKEFGKYMTPPEDPDEGGEL